MGCTVDTAEVTLGQMFALELMFGLTAIFLAFGVGLDPRQSNTYGSLLDDIEIPQLLTFISGPAFAPILVGITLGLNTLCSGMLRPGYTGAS